MGIDKLELVWPGKDERASTEPGKLVAVPALGYGAAGARVNLLIRGDNLPVLLALEKTHAGTVQCVYIDPPYNTGSAFAQYEDDVEHAHWLGMMRDRLEALRRLLRPSGVIFVSIGESEAAYLKVLMDEVFGRQNFCGQFIWEKKRKPSFRDANMGGVTEYVLAFARDRSQSPPFVFGLTTPGKKYPINNAGNGLRVLTFPAGAVTFRCGDRRFEPQDMSEGRVLTELLDPLEVREGRNAGPFRLRGEWRYAQATLDGIVRKGETIVIHKAPFRPNHLKAGGAPKKIKNLLSIAHYRMSTYEDAAEESRALFGEGRDFDYPKPEMLLSTLIGAVTAPGDIVLDAFAGSGTTGAAAHKLGRRWIMVERGEHCETHIVPRLRKVIDGADAGGITRECGWRGGGGFRYLRLKGLSR